MSKRPTKEKSKRLIRQGRITPKRYGIVIEMPTCEDDGHTSWLPADIRTFGMLQTARRHYAVMRRPRGKYSDPAIDIRIFDFKEWKFESAA